MKELTILEIDEVSGGIELLAGLWRSWAVKLAGWGYAYEVATDFGEGFSQGMSAAHQQYLESSCKADDPIRWP